MRSSDLLNTFGLTTHIPYMDGRYAKLGNVASDLAYLGITNVLDNVTNGEYESATLDKYIALAKQGIRFDFVVENSDDTPAKIDARLKLASSVEAAVPGAVRTVEG